MKTISIYFEDLNKEAQEKYKDDFEGPRNVNAPIAIMDIEDEVKA